MGLQVISDCPWCSLEQSLALPVAPPGPQGLWLYSSCFTITVCLPLEQNPLMLSAQRDGDGGSSHTLTHPLLQRVMGRAGWVAWG